MQEVQSISTGDTLQEFYSEYSRIKEHHKQYPNEPVENLERAYKRAEDGGPAADTFAGDVDGMFTGEEAFGKSLDLTMLHEDYLNLPGVKDGRKLTYLQYLDLFDDFVPPQCTISRHDKMTDQYFGYVGLLTQYLESFMQRTRPLEDVEKLFSSFDDEFEKDWTSGKVPGWAEETPHTNGGAQNGAKTNCTGEGVWCAACAKEFKNENVYESHLTGKKHIKNAAASQDTSGTANGAPNNTAALARAKERAVAAREDRIRRLTAAMQTVRTDTRVNVERKAGMTDRERQQELQALYDENELAITTGSKTVGEAEAEEADGDEKIYNPLKLPLAWDGKPIPFWLYKLHGLGVEFSCEICGNYVYMGRRAFDKHFGEARHVYGLKCLGITNTGLFREITGIQEAERLWEKVKRDKEREKKGGDADEEMEDAQGNVMPRKVYEDLKKAGLL